jgi:thymidylate synthase
MRWFLSGSNNINDLGKNVQKWWTPWADKQGVVKFNYGEQLRHWYGEEEFDQLKSFIYGIKNHPFSRRNVMTTWNASDMNNAHCPITNCHGTIIQAFVRESQVGLKNILDITMYQRSVDVICGLPHNWIQYWAFLQWLAKITGHVVGSFYWIGGDIHIYEQHFDLAKKLARLSEEFPKASGYVPTFLYNPVPDETQFKPADFSLSHPYEPLCSDHAELIV